MKALLKYTLLIILFFRINANAQISIKGKTTFCLDKLAIFTYKAPVGKTVKKYEWDFGDSYTSNDTLAQHLYKKGGTFTVKIKATFTDNSNITNSLKVTVNSLPKAKFIIQNKSTFCNYDTNFIYFKDLSEKASPSQTLITRVAVWDDGKSNLYSNIKKGDIVLHKYTKPNTYKIRFEVTDKSGCKSEENKIVVIKRGILINYNLNKSSKLKPGLVKRYNLLLKDTLQNMDCKKGEVCIDLRPLLRSKNGNTYDFYINNKKIENGNLPKLTRSCYKFNRDKIFKYKYIVTSIDGCKDTIERTIDLKLDTSNLNIKLSKNKICYGTANPIIVSMPKGIFFNNIQVTANGILIPHPLCPINCRTGDFLIRPKVMGLLPGKYNLKLKFTLGKCIIYKYAKFEVLGPVAQAKVINDKQCLVQRPVYFFANDKYITKNTTFKWYIEDDIGKNCTENKRKKTNFNKNCKNILGSYGKHIYTEAKEYNGITLMVKDTLTGCEDTTSNNVNLHYCGFINPFKQEKLCKGNIFHHRVNKYSKPYKFSLDSGTTWTLFPAKINKDTGVYDVSLIYKTKFKCWVRKYENDTMDLVFKEITYHDTIHVKKFLRVLNVTADTLSYTVQNMCDSIIILVKRQGNTYHNGETFVIDWGDGKRIRIDFNKDSLIPFFRHVYRQKELAINLLIVLNSEEGCIKGISKRIHTGTKRKIEVLDSQCINQKICFKAIITDNNSLSLWNDSSNFGTFKWEIDGKPFSPNKFKHCHTFNTGGLHKISLITKDKYGCTSSLNKDIMIQKVIANVKDDSKNFYCSDIRKFFDSSKIVFPKQDDSLVAWSWEFSKDPIITYLKNPVKVLNNHNKNTRVKHIAISQSGCKDSVEFDIVVLKTQPYFSIPDTIGCSVFDVLFKNKSRRSDTYIWEFGDKNNTIKKTKTSNDERFKYTKPGRYYISLVGVDTFYNPITKNTYYCTSRFPGEGIYKDTNRSILVLASLHTSFNTKDSICLGDSIFLQSTSDSGFYYDHWDMGNGDTFRTVLDTSFYYVYSQNGAYKINLQPHYPLKPGQPNCLHKDSQRVFVNSVNADFEIDPKSEAPIFYFNNKTIPTNAKLNWDFGQPLSGSRNTSIKQNPEHNYGKQIKNFKVCLYSHVRPGCKDSICKAVYNDYFKKLRIFNVFTPDNNDGLNDEYDVQIRGESTYDLKIYNRWNQLVYHSEKDGKKGDGTNWNGKLFNTGTPCASGVYYYVFKYAFKTDPENFNIINGSVTVLRKDGK